MGASEASMWRCLWKAILALVARCAARWLSLPWKDTGWLNTLMLTGAFGLDGLLAQADGGGCRRVVTLYELGFLWLYLHAVRL